MPTPFACGKPTLPPLQPEVHQPKNYENVTIYIVVASFVAIAFAFFLFLKVKAVKYVRLPRGWLWIVFVPPRSLLRAPLRLWSWAAGVGFFLLRALIWSRGEESAQCT
jgi:hypothetical protein